MSKRWLSGVLIFALGFGCASLVTIATAQEIPEDRGELDDGLSYVNTEREIRLVNTGKNVYVVMVRRAPGTTPTETPVLYRGGVISIPTYGLARLAAYRLDPIAILEEDFWRPCAMGDCSWIGPLPPPPPPIVPPDLGAMFLTPQ